MIALMLVGAALGQDFEPLTLTVPLVAQPTNMSCWAAAAAMVVAYRDKQEPDITAITEATGYWQQFYQGRYPDENGPLIETFGLQQVFVNGSKLTPEEIRQSLATRGPLWVEYRTGDGAHAVVITGISGDGTPAGTTIIYNDPWPPYGPDNTPGPDGVAGAKDAEAQFQQFASKMFLVAAAKIED